MKTAPLKLSRRKFLLAATAGTAATGTGVALLNRKDARPAQHGESESSKGYQLTEHVRNYYRTAKI